MVTTSRKVSPEERQRRLVRALTSLERGLIAIDEGDASGYDDVLRIARLLVLAGRGNRLLFRVAKDADAELLKLSVTPEADPLPGQTLPLVIAVGAIPSDGVPVANRPVRTRTLLHLKDLLGKKVLRIDGSVAPKEIVEKVCLTWEELLNLLANKMGASHSDDDVPRVFDEVYRHGFIGELHPLAFAVRAFGVALLRIGSDLCGQLGMTQFQLRSLMVGPDEKWIGEFHWYGRLGGRIGILVNAVSKAGAHMEISWKLERDSGGWP